MSWLPHGFMALLAMAIPGVVAAQTSAYTLSFPQPESGWMQVELRLVDVPASPLTLHMSVSSPGRYGPHDFVRNVTAVEIADASGTLLTAVRPTATEWRLERPPSSVRVRYRISGDRLDGTYLAIDATHAHINMPAALMWASGFEAGTVQVRFELPSARPWRVATQLFPGADDRTFTAPNLQYLMDSPTELSAFAERTFSVTEGPVPATFRLAVHHEGTDAEVNALASAAEQVVRQARQVFGEFPRFDGGTYTFIADYLPRASGDGMEHRNSTILTSPRPLRGGAADALDTLSHEFFHVWNVERIRPRSLEPFDLTRTNESAELWLAEGFTQYYGPLILTRAGLLSEQAFAGEIGSLVSQVLASPARRVRSLEDMSRFAVNVDSIAVARPPNLDQVFLSYYTWGGAVALALDLSLRERSNDRVTLDHFMRALWERHGRPGGRSPGLVERPYTVEDLKTTLTSVSGDERFTERFFSRYIHGRDVADYGRLLRRVGLVVRSTPPDGGRSRSEIVRIEDTGGRVSDAQDRARTAWLHP